MEEIKIVIPALNYKKIFWILAVFMGILMPILSFDYGVVEDDQNHNRHGKILLDYYTGKDSLSLATQCVDWEKGEQNIEDFTSLIHLIRIENSFYGGFFDLLTNFLHNYFKFIGEYEFRNIIKSLFGFLLFLFTGLLAKELGGWKTGLLAFLFIILSPSLFGHSMTNARDISCAAFYIFSLFHIVKLIKELPKIKFKRALYLILNISLLINIRAFGIVMIAFLFLAVFVWWILQNYKDHFKNIDFKKSFILALKILGLGSAAYRATSIFWPYAQTNPFKIPLYVAFKSNVTCFQASYQLFEGEFISNINVPWYYQLKCMYITMPLHILLGIFLIILLYAKKIIRLTPSANLFLISFVLFTSLFPIFYAIVSKSPAYDVGRHFLFTIPPLICLSALSWDNLFNIIKKKIVKYALYLFLVILFFQPFRWMVANHPMESLYFSPLIGGVNSASHNYEIDYWGVAIKPAIKWLEKNPGDATPEKPARVQLCYGTPLKASYYINKIPYLKFVTVNFNSTDWDYAILTISQIHWTHDLKNWPPQNMVYKVKVDTVTACAIVKNVYVDNIASMEAAASANPTATGYIQLSVLYYNDANYIKCIEASKKALLLDSLNFIAYNNMCTSYNCLMMFDEAKLAGEKALKISPNYELTKNNLKETEKGIIQRKEKKFSTSQYINLSYNYYVMGNYKACISTCRELLTIDPSNAIAYNNICTCYNCLGNFSEAKKACDQAIKLKPDFDLAKNNLKIAEKGLSDPK